jgi:hypothetical protein
MSKPISWKRAGIIVVLLHVGGFGLLMGVNNIKSRLHRAERQKENERLLAQSSSQDDKSWPASNLPQRVVAYPKKLAKQVTEEVSSKPLQEAAAEKIATVLNTATSVKKEVETTYTDLQKLYLETTKKLETAKQQTVARAEKKIAVKPSTPEPRPVVVKRQPTPPKPKPTPVYTRKTVPQPTTTTVVRKSTYTYKKPESSIDPVYEYTEEIKRATPPPNNELDYNTLRYSYEKIVYDPETGRQQRVRVMGPMPIGVH